jgi:RNA polymerase sigma-70 factor (ECF subfamily)
VRTLVSCAGGDSLRERSHAAADGLLVSRVRSGDHGAGALLYRRHAPRLRRYLLAVLGDARDVEDLTHQTFVAVFDRIHTYADRGLPFERWMFAIARNAALKHRRDARRTEVIDPAALDRDRELEAQREAVAIESPTASFEALTSTLSACQRRALLLLYAFDMSPEDAGVATLGARRTRIGL